MYQIEISPSAAKEIRTLRRFEQQRVLDALEQLRHEPETETRNRKQLQRSDDLPWAPPVWELRVAEHRVFYTVEGSSVVVVLAVRHKGRRRTKEIL